MGPAIALVVWAGGTGLVSGRTEVADLVAVLLLVAAIYQPLHVVVSAAEATQKALAAMRRIEEVLATAPEIAEAPGAADPRPSPAPWPSRASPSATTPPPRCCGS